MMENEYKNRLNMPGILAMFVLLTLILIPLNAAYILIMAFMPSIYLCFLIVLGFGLLQAALIHVFFKLFKVTNKGIGLLFVLIALLIGVYFKWNFWVSFQIFYASDEFNLITDFPDILLFTTTMMTTPADTFYFISELNAYGTWGVDEGEAITGAMLTIIWIIEFFVMNGPAAIAPFTQKLVFIAEKNAWASPRYIPLAYDAFDSYELDALRALDFRPVVDKPLSARPNGAKTYRLAFLGIGNEWTGHIAVYKMQRFNKTTYELIQGEPIFIGVEECQKLNTLIQEKYAPQPTQTPPELSDNIPAEE
ncbi:MAG: hypothetical protein LBU77_01725 [Clostridiales bacterium]|nr:hypothetical protein [Clostridiales bacterium]